MGHWYAITHVPSLRGDADGFEEYAVMNFTDTNSTSLINQASFLQIQLFMDVTRSYMESVDWVERYFYFGAMYEMVRRFSPQRLFCPNMYSSQQGVNPLNTLFDPAGASRRTGALSKLGVQYARSNGSLTPTDRNGPSSSATATGSPYYYGTGSRRDINGLVLRALTISTCLMFLV